MPSCSLTPWVAVALATAAVLVLLLVRWFRAKFVLWLPIYGYYPGSKWGSNLRSTDPIFLAKALQKAESCLIANTGWSAANLALVGHYVRVLVKDTERWGGLWGGRGQQEYTLVVGPSLAGLCHELAHLCEQVLDSAQDHDHDTWGANGVVGALDAYDEWLVKQGGGDRGTPVLRKMEACRYRSSK